MIALDTIAIGILAVHALWALAYLLGALGLRAVARAQVPDGFFERGFDFVLATASGLAVLILGLYALGSVGLLRPVWCLILWLALAAGFTAVALRAGNSVADLRVAILRPLTFLRSRAIVILYAIALVESAPAILPPVDWDSTMYHLANAVNWAHAGTIYADPYIRQPYFAFNFELLYALAFVLHLDRFVLFVGWLPFAASAFAIHLATSSLLARYVFRAEDTGRLPSALGFATAIAYLASPLVLHVAVSGYVDVAIGFFFLTTCIALERARDRFQPNAAAAAIAGAALCGMKLQMIAFVPLIAIAVIWIGRAGLVRAKTIGLTVAGFLICASPWYVRNLIFTGDPIPPILNVMFGHPDPIWSAADYAGVKWNLGYGEGNIFRAPLDFFLNKPFLDEPGTSTNIACIALIPIAAIAFFLLRRHWNISQRIVLWLALNTYAIAAIAGVSVKIERYVLAYFPVFLVSLTLIIAIVVQRAFARTSNHRAFATAAASIACVALLATPEPRGADAYNVYSSHFQASETAALSPERIIAATGAGYREADDIAALVASAHVPGVILAPGFENTAYSFRRHDVSSVGDWFGPGRYSDLQAAIERHAVPAYLDRFHVTAVMIGDRNIGWPDADRPALMAQLLKLKYVDVTLAGDVVREYIRPDVFTKVPHDILAAAPRGADGAVHRIDFRSAFASGSINSRTKAATPTGAGALLYSWQHDNQPVQALTIVAGYTYRYAPLTILPLAKLSVDVAKPFAEGKSAIAWIDLRIGSKTTRIASVECPPKTPAGIGWQHLEIALPPTSEAAEIRFGASSVSGGGVADWIAFADPVLAGAVLGEPASHQGRR